MKTYTESFVVKWHEIDLDKKLRPFAFMNMAQECANVHSSALNFGYSDLMEYNQVWVLSRIKIQYIVPPVWGDKVSMSTWHKGKSGLFWLRDFMVKDDNDQVVAVATSSWVIMNIKTRHIERKTIFDLKDDIVDKGLDINAIDKPCDKLLPIKELSLVREFIVLNSHIDFNKHANNAKYIEWITDSVSSSFLDRYNFTDIQINYLQEAHLDDKISLYVGQRDITSNIVELYYEGRRDDSVIFQALVTYKLK